MLHCTFNKAIKQQSYVSILNRRSFMFIFNLFQVELEKIERTIKNEQCKDTRNTGYRRQKTQGEDILSKKHNTEN
jgi:hypothetical protein